MDFESFYNKYYEIDDSVSIIDNFSDEILAAEYISEMREALYEALMMLNEMQWKIVIYKFFYEKNSTQISEMTGIPSASVRVQLSRALEKLNILIIDNNLHKKVIVKHS